MANRWRNNGNSDRFYFFGSKVTANGDCSHEIKRCLLLGSKAMTNLNRVLPTNPTNRTFADKCPCSQSCDFSTSHVRMRELDHKEGWVPKNWCFWTMVSSKTLESLLEFKEIKLLSPKGNQFWIFIGRTDAQAEAPILWPPDEKGWHSLEKTPMLGTIEGRRRRGWQRTRMLDITDSMDMSLSKLWEMLHGREDCCAIQGASKNSIQLCDWTTTPKYTTLP